ncbi:MAG: hypothetical protein R2706_20950 [Acidimicrobiales bacterium]
MGQAPGEQAVAVSPRRELTEHLWVLVMAGIERRHRCWDGKRLAMFVLRSTSPDRVIGMTSDDGFEIGRFTLNRTYNGKLALGAAVGLLGVLAYQAVAPWLFGPSWFRRSTVGAASGVVVGSMLVHLDGVVSVSLQPMWLAVALFVASAVLVPRLASSSTGSRAGRSVTAGDPGSSRPSWSVRSLPSFLSSSCSVLRWRSGSRFDGPLLDAARCRSLLASLFDAPG